MHRHKSTPLLMELLTCPSYNNSNLVKTMGFPTSHFSPNTAFMALEHGHGGMFMAIRIETVHGMGYVTGFDRTPRSLIGHISSIIYVYSIEY